MAPRSPRPELHAQDFELPDYPADADHPLLNGSSDPSTRIPRPTHPSYRRPGAFSSFRRWWKPLAIIFIPLGLLFIYGLVHPHVPGLPPLPKVIFHSETEDAVESSGKTGMREESCLCGMTSTSKNLCELYPAAGLQQSRVVEGTGARVRKMLNKALEGKALKVGILGGSVSACHGLHPSPDYPQGDPKGPGCYTSVLSQWLNETFPQADHEVMNGAIGGMDSSYYAFCGTHHIALDTDLIILEFDVNDQPDLAYQAFFDQLLRVLLDFHSQPAVVILGTWSPQVALDVGYADPQIVHSPIARFRDVPYVSMKQLVFNTFLRFPRSTAASFFQPDKVHPNIRGHRVLADILISYLETELCQLSRYGLPVVLPQEYTLGTQLAFSDLVDVPFPLDPLHLVDPFTAPEGWETTFDPVPLHSIATEQRYFVLPTTPYHISPVGMFTPLRDVVDLGAPDPSSASHVLNLPQPQMYCADANDREHPMRPTTHQGWEPFVLNGEKHFWVSSTVGSRIRVEIEVNAGRVAVYYYRSQKYNLGDALCWVDDNEKGGVRLPGYWTKQYNVAVVAYIDEKVTPGAHYVTCEVSSQTSHPTNPDAHHWRLVAVMAS